MNRVVFILSLGICITGASTAEEESLAEKAPSTEEASLVESWDQGVIPMAPQKYDGKGGVPQRPFVSEKKSVYSHLILGSEKAALKKRLFREPRKNGPRKKKLTKKNSAKKRN